MVRDTVEQRGCHPVIAKHADPFCELELGPDEVSHRGAARSGLMAHAP